MIVFSKEICLCAVKLKEKRHVFSMAFLTKAKMKKILISVNNKVLVNYSSISLTSWLEKKIIVNSWHLLYMASPFS